MSDVGRHVLNTDAPIADKDDDCLNRSAFVTQISQAIMNLPSNSNITIGVHAPWGYGKTSVLNMLCAELGSRNTITVRKYNPWRFTSDESMFRSFVLLLAEAIGASLETKTEAVKAKAGRIIRFCRWFTRLGSVFSPEVMTVDALLSKLEGVAHRGDSCELEELRSRIITQLDKSAIRTVVMIDDIDRLDKHETQTLFRLIKACADFPSICYVLFFDEVAVAKALGERFGGGDEASGRAFLEKIIQMPLKLQQATKEDLRALCFKQIELALSANKIDLSRDQVNLFISSFDGGASIRLTTPRAANRYGNCISFALPMLVGEVNPVDLLLIESLRVFFPEVYCVVSENYNDFSGINDENYNRSEAKSRLELLLNDTLAGLRADDSESAKRLLKDLFPRLAGIYGNMCYGRDSELAWTKEKRICSPVYCSRYFSYSISPADVSDVELSNLIGFASARDTEYVQAWLSNNIGGPKAKRIIEKLRVLETSIAEVAAETLAVGLAQIGRLLPNPQSVFHFADPPSQAAILISHLLRRIADRAGRASVAGQIIDVADPVWFGAECFRWLYLSNDPDSQDKNTLSESEHSVLHKALVERIKLLAKSGSYFFDIDCRQEHYLLYEWQRAEGREGPERPATRRGLDAA